MRTPTTQISAGHRSPAQERAGFYGRPLRRTAQRGFTILEVAVAACVMAMGLATSVIALQSGFKHVDLARGTTLASQIIQSEMERIRLLSWAGICALPEKETFDGSAFFSDSADVAGKFTVTRTRQPDATRPTAAMNVSVAVQWNSYDGRPHTRRFTSIYSQNGLYDYYYTVAHP